LKGEFQKVYSKKYTGWGKCYLYAYAEGNITEEEEPIPDSVFFEITWFGGCLAGPEPPILWYVAEACLQDYDGVKKYYCSRLEEVTCDIMDEACWAYIKFCVKKGDEVTVLAKEWVLVEEFEG